ncbi:MAG: hypothetical protein L0387_00110 [Acidobacteria bacterium]|nr:hypothetical protein [Acidobacteriota bacterium]
MKLSIKAMALAFGLVWGGGVLVLALINLAPPNYGKAVLELCSSVYPGYHVTGTVGSVFVGTLYALLDGAIGGGVLAWLYNQFVK